VTSSEIQKSPTLPICPVSRTLLRGGETHCSVITPKNINHSSHKLSPIIRLHNNVLLFFVHVCMRVFLFSTILFSLWLLLSINDPNWLLPSRLASAWTLPRNSWLQQIADGTPLGIRTEWSRARRRGHTGTGLDTMDLCHLTVTQAVNSGSRNLALDGLHTGA